MQLFETKIGTLPNALYYEGIEERDIACLYYLIEGRNAWHSTWTNWYRDGCMHTTLDAAKMSAERQRKPGSKFYIREIPALVLKSESSILLLLRSILAWFLIAICRMRYTTVLNQEMLRNAR